MKKAIYCFALALIFIINSCSKPYSPTENDWVQYKKDNHRSNLSSLDLNLDVLNTSWVYSSVQEPTNAWHGPAREDSYSNTGQRLPAMRDYDKAFHTIVVNGKLYFNSSADDALHCLDVKTGKELWFFSATAPIRLSPTYYAGNIYFGSDDGFVYCVNAENGELEWKFSPQDNQHDKLLNNGRIASFWPVRTDVLVEDGIAYFSNSLFTWNATYFCAVDALTGEVGSEGTYVKEYKEQTIEGHLASSGSKIIAPRGRVAPLFINKKDGEIKGSLANSLGCFLLVTDNNEIAHLSGSRKKNLGFSSQNKGTKTDMINFPNGKSMVADAQQVYVLADNSISAFNRTDNKNNWLNTNYRALSLLKAGNTLFAGGHNVVYAINPNNGALLWEQQVKGASYGLAVADSALFVSTDLGAIYCFRANGTIQQETPKLDTAAYKKKVENLYSGDVKHEDFYQLALSYVSKSSAQLTWKTTQAMPSEIEYKRLGEKSYKTLTANEVVRNHSLLLNNLAKKTMYCFRLKVGNKYSREFKFDNSFNYSNFELSEQVSTKKLSSETIKLAQDILSKEKRNKGIIALVGTQLLDLGYALVQHSNFNAVFFEEDASQANKLQKQLTQEGIYGRRLSVYKVTSKEDLKLPENLFNKVIASDSKDYAFFEEVLIPESPFFAVSNNTIKHQIQKPKAEGFGVWTHQYGQADNTAYGNEKSFWGCSQSEDFQAKWLGQPGPRFHIDRNGRNNAPLAINGLLFRQGIERLIAMDANNGEIIWSKKLPNFLRNNIPKDCGNWTVDNDYLYTATNSEYCYKIENQTGKIITAFKTSDYIKGTQEYDWSYISVQGNALIGSTVFPNGAYTTYYGGGNDGWADAQTGPITRKVSSSHLFSLNKTDGSKNWVYKPNSSRIVNPTITISNNKIYFVETISKKYAKFKESKLGKELFKNVALVSLDLQTGKVLSRKKITIEQGESAFYMIESQSKLVLLTSHTGKYYIYTYSEKEGTLLWKKELNWRSGDHGWHMQKPTILNGNILLRTYILDINTGELLDHKVPKAGHGCASVACSENNVFYRGGSVTVWNSQAKQYSKWERLRPGCWISTIPANGMLLSPEGGGGCSCGNWLETSVSFTPITRAPIVVYADHQYGFVDSTYVHAAMKPGIKGTLRYTLDGSIPDADAKLYKQAIEITKTCVVTVGLFADGKLQAYRTRKLERGFPEPKISKELSYKNNTFWAEISSPSKDAQLYYALNGTDFELYKGAIEITQDSKIEAKAVWEIEGDESESELVQDSVKVMKLFKSTEQSDLDKGFSCKLYNVKLKKLPDFFQLLPAQTFKLNTSLNPALFEATGKSEQNNFALFIEGYFYAEQTDVYGFNLKSDDGSLLEIDGTTLINHDGTHAATDKKGSVLLEKGYHPFRLSYFDAGGGKLVELKYKNSLNTEYKTVTDHELYIQK